MQDQWIAHHQFIKDLQIIINQPIWRVIHPADGWLFLDLGKPYQDYISDEKGSEIPYIKGEYQLYITGDWQIAQNKTVVESRLVKPNEAQKDYFSRIEDVANNFPIKSISGVNYYDKNVVFNAGDGCHLTVDVTDEDSLTLTIVQLDESNRPIAYRHFEAGNEQKPSE